MAKSRQKKLDKMDKITLMREKPKPVFVFRKARTPGRIVIECKDLVLGYDEPLTKPVSVQVEQGKKIAIRGVNGIGKSTLLKTLLKLIPPVSGTVEHDHFVIPGYFEQEEESTAQTPLEVIWNEFPAMTNAEVRGALAQCGLTTEHISSQMRVLSGGENAKVRLCRIMLREVNLLVLDEPTNHLDTDAKDALKQALRDYKGTVLIVSHEPEFYMDIADTVWNIEEWSTKII